MTRTTTTATRAGTGAAGASRRMRLREAMTAASIAAAIGQSAANAPPQDARELLVLTRSAREVATVPES